MEKLLDTFTSGWKGGKRREKGCGGDKEKEKGTIITKDSSPLSVLIAPRWR